MSTLPTFTGLGHGPTVLMLHGIGGGHLAFAPQVETFAGAGYRAVAWDMPGYGHSAPIEPYTFKGLAQSCIHLIEALLAGEKARPTPHATEADLAATGSAVGASSANEPAPAPAVPRGIILLGHSMGGMVAQEVVARRPDLVRALVLVGTSPAFARKPDGSYSEGFARKFVGDRTAPLDAGKSMADVAAQLVPGMVGTGADPAGLRLAEHCMAQVPAATYRRALEALVTFDRQADLARITVPTLLLAGELDKAAPPSVMKAMATAVPDGHYVELAGTGHLLNLEAPEAFDAAVLNFLADLHTRARRVLH